MPSRKNLVVAGLATLVGVLIGAGAWAIVAGVRPQVTSSRPTPSPSGPSASSSPGSRPTKPPVAYTPPPVGCPSTTVLQASQPDPNDPLPRNSAALAYDAVRKQLVLFGGDSGTGSPLGDTWVWNGSSWRQQHPTKSPPPRAWAAMTFDAAHGVVVLFGGGPGAALNDTWIWDGNNWTEQHPATTPPVAAQTAMDYDAAFGQVVLVVPPIGAMGGPPQTWSWDGANWHQLHPAASPRNQSTAMAYDPVAKQMVLFDRHDTWTFDAAGLWTRVPAQGPSQSGLPTMAYDAATRSMVLFNDGGSEATWTWDGAAWTQRCPPATPPYLSSTGPMPAMAYDADAGVVVVFGGISASSFVSNATWTWDGKTWVQWHAKP